MIPTVLRSNRDFRRLWAAGAVSQVGDWLSFVAVSTLAMASSGPLGLAVVYAAHALPGALLSPFAGALIDRADRRRVMIAADLIAGGLTVAMAVAAIAGAIVLVQILLLARSAVAALTPPAEAAAVRRLVWVRDLPAANAILAGTWSVAYVAGMALGGVTALLGPALALGLDAATFAVAAAMRLSLPAMPVGSGRRLRFGALVRATPSDVGAALRVAAADPPLMRAVLAKAPLALAGGAGWVAINQIAAEVAPFGAAALSFGVLQAVRGAGTGIGPAIAARLIRAGASGDRLQHAARAAMLIALVALAVTRSPIGLVPVVLVWGMGGGANWVLGHAALQASSPDDVIGRLAAFDELLVALTMVIGVFAGAAIATAAGAGAAALLGAALGLIGLDLARRVAARASGTRRSALAVSPAA